MEWKKFRLVLLSFLAGVVLMTGVVLGAQNGEYFSGNTSEK